MEYEILQCWSSTRIIAVTVVVVVVSVAAVVDGEQISAASAATWVLQLPKMWYVVSYVHCIIFFRTFYNSSLTLYYRIAIL